MMYQTEGQYALSEDPTAWSDYRETIKAAGLEVDIEPIEKWSFYDAVTTEDHVLTIQTADQHRFANILLTVGVRMN